MIHLCKLVSLGVRSFGSTLCTLTILSLRNLQGFLLYGFLEENSLCLLSLVFIDVHVILSVKDPKIIMLA